MCALLALRQFVNERLTSAAEEIFGVFEKTIFEYEEEIHRQRKLLQIFWKPEVKLHRIEHQQQHVCEDQKQQQVCVQRTTSSLDQKDPPSVYIKEEELCSSDELKQETDAFMVAAAHQESDHREDHTLNFNIEDVRSVRAKETSFCVTVQSSVVPEVKSEQQLLSHSSEEAESQYWEGGQHGDSGSTTAEPEHNSHTNPEYNETMSTVHSDAPKGKKSMKCNVCEKVFTYESLWQRHMSKHSGLKTFGCKKCRREFRSNSHLKDHMKIHTDKMPYPCKICTKGFYHKASLKRHIFLSHEKPFTCKSCGKTFGFNVELYRHMRSHAGEKSFTCLTCGKKL